MNNISQVFAIGDVHGCNSLLERIHKKILKKSKKVKGNKILIYLGDYVDRGHKAKETIDAIINFKPKDFKCIFIRGNHDQMLLDFVNGKSRSLTMWLYNGGAETLKSYCGNKIAEKLINNSSRIQHIRKKFIRRNVLCSDGTYKSAFYAFGTRKNCSADPENVPTDDK